ncbi:glycosyltransferase [Lysobacter ciconiae]|uniref:Glycosyltransferase n=1 Tax=Novilysobacter ciconiae TaxID=2781022 RepID=A0A7S6UEI7_9GAMM|nr:glycosyltransferase family 4 protein [Lysobacter ciconiae]QOW18796.1 glycosyltransferase [Lysobacter ciconiae]
MAAIATVEAALMTRLLVLTTRLPYPPTEGHQLRSWHLLKALASRHEVTLMSFLRRDDEPAQAGPLRDILAALETFPIPGERSPIALGRALLAGTLTNTPYLAARYASAEFRKRLRERAGQADLVHVDMLPLMAHADCVPDGIPLVMNAHNVEHRLLRIRASIERRAFARAFLRHQVSRLHDFEQAACRRADAILVCSDDDAETLRALAPGARVQLVPNGVDVQANQPAATQASGNRLVFVGQMGWFPNRDGVEWFLADIFPRILAVRPDTQFVLVGKSAGLEVPGRVAANVHLPGFVSDLRPLVHDAAVYVVPLRAGSGTRLKVLEAMALGKAIVTTRIGSEGILLQPGDDALFADEPQAFADAVLALLADPARAHALGLAARRCAQSHYGWEGISRTALDFYDTLLEDAPPGAHLAEARGLPIDAVA